MIGLWDERLTDHDAFSQLGTEDDSRREAYAALLGVPIEDEHMESIRAAARINLPFEIRGRRGEAPQLPPLSMDRRRLFERRVVRLFD